MFAISYQLAHPMKLYLLMAYKPFRLDHWQMVMYEMTQTPIACVNVSIGISTPNSQFAPVEDPTKGQWTGCACRPSRRGRS